MRLDWTYTMKHHPVTVNVPFIIQDIPIEMAAALTEAFEEHVKVLAAVIEKLDVAEDGTSE